MSDSQNNHSTAPSATDVLLKEYDHRFNEVIFHSERYNKQADVLNLFLTSAVALGTLIFSGSTKSFLGLSMSVPKEDNALIHCGFLIFAGLLVFFFFSSILNSLFMIYLNGSRIASIEKQLNISVGKEILTWDSMAMPHFFRMKPMGKHQWIRPPILAGLWIFLIFILIGVALCFLCYRFAPKFGWYYIPAIAMLVSFHIYQWKLLNTIGLEEMRFYFGLSTVLPMRRQLRIESVLCVIPVLSVIITVVSSVKLHAFFFSSRYTFPLLSIPSVYIGDLLVLPILNYKLIRWFKESCFPGKYFLGRSSFAVAIIALAVNTWLHWQWVHDPWSGFMDVAYGRLTVAGWDHFLFSSFEMWLVGI